MDKINYWSVMGKNELSKLDDIMRSKNHVFLNMEGCVDRNDLQGDAQELCDAAIELRKYSSAEVKTACDMEKLFLPLVEARARTVLFDDKKQEKLLTRLLQTTELAGDSYEDGWREYVLGAIRVARARVIRRSDLARSLDDVVEGARLLDQAAILLSVVDGVHASYIYGDDRAHTVTDDIALWYADLSRAYRDHGMIVEMGKSGVLSTLFHACPGGLKEMLFSLPSDVDALTLTRIAVLESYRKSGNALSRGVEVWDAALRELKRERTESARDLLVKYLASTETECFDMEPMVAEHFVLPAFYTRRMLASLLIGEHAAALHGSLAEKSGYVPDDAVLKINSAYCEHFILNDRKRALKSLEKAAAIRDSILDEYPSFYAEVKNNKRCDHTRYFMSLPPRLLDDFFFMEKSFAYVCEMKQET